MDRTDLENMAETSEKTGRDKGRATGAAVLHALRPAVPAVIGAAALTFLFAAVMPFSWVAGISWNLYLDRLSDFFVPPIGNAGRLALALGMAAIAAVIAGLVALLIARPDAVGLSELGRRFRMRSAGADEGDSDDFLTRRRRVDLHPDAPPRPPIRAGRDLPAGGLGPLDGSRADDVDNAGFWPAEVEEANDAAAEELVLADLAPDANVETGDEPWLQPAELAGPIMPDPADNSLGAMVARLEAGLSRRRQEPGVVAATLAIPVAEGAAPEDDPQIDFALEAALGTLQRMTRQSAG
ncbi:MAG: hypothetical protein KYX64_00890 [Sphingopyxis sp.]|nr:hypothetical protein [Sphingopyxis sp.]